MALSTVCFTIINCRPPNKTTQLKKKGLRIFGIRFGIYLLTVDINTDNKSF